MKFLLLALCSVFALPLAANGVCSSGSCPLPASQDFVYGDAALQLPEDLSEAFLGIPQLNQKQQELRARGFDLSEEEQQRLTAYRLAVKGLVVVEVGFASCAPCRALFKALTQADENGTSVADRISGKGGRFYQLDSLNCAKKILNAWKVRGVPVLIFFKDGAEIARLNGFNAQNPSDAMNKIKSLLAGQ